MGGSCCTATPQGPSLPAHYCVIHPERVRAVVLSACGGYASRMRACDGRGGWGHGAPHSVGMGRVSHNRSTSGPIRPRGVAAALPIMVVVGSQEREALKPGPGHAGNTRVEYALQWVEDMNRFARSCKEEEGGPDDRRRRRTRLAKLNPTAQKFLAGVLSAKSREVEVPMHARAGARTAGSQHPPRHGLRSILPPVIRESAPFGRAGNNRFRSIVRGWPRELP